MKITDNWMKLVINAIISNFKLKNAYLKARNVCGPLNQQLDI